jgi:cytochrome c
MSMNKGELGWKAFQEFHGAKFIRGTRKNIYLPIEIKDSLRGIPKSAERCVAARTAERIEVNGQRPYARAMVGNDRMYLQLKEKVKGKVVWETYKLHEILRTCIRGWEIAKKNGDEVKALEAWIDYNEKKKPLIVLSKKEFNRPRDIVRAERIRTGKHKVKDCTFCHIVKGVKIRCGRHTYGKERQPSRFSDMGVELRQAA